MHIAQIAPLCEAVPPKQYGGTERVVSYLTKELAGQGHDVTLFASGDSQTQGHLASVFMLPQTCLGPAIDAAAKTLWLRNPQLPAYLDRTWIANLRLGDQRCAFTVDRHGSTVSLNVVAKPDGWHILAIQ